MKKDLVKTLTRNAVVAAIYIVLVVAIGDFSFNIFQVRVAEALVLLCFFRRDYVYGLTIGCLISNLFSPLMPWDLVFGTLATFASCLLVSFSKHMLIASFIPVIINGFVVGAELSIICQASFWPTCGFVALGEFIAVSVIGYLLMTVLAKNKAFLEVIGANRNEGFKW